MNAPFTLDARVSQVCTRGGRLASPTPPSLAVRPWSPMQYSIPKWRSPESSRKRAWQLRRHVVECRKMHTLPSTARKRCARVHASYWARRRKGLSFEPSSSDRPRHSGDQARSRVAATSARIRMARSLSFRSSISGIAICESRARRTPRALGWYRRPSFGPKQRDRLCQS